VNLLLFYPTEISGSALSLLAERARWVAETFRPGVGDSLVCGMLNGKIGTALITSVARDEICAEVTLDRTAPERISGELIVGLSRPQTIKKVLHFAASVGVETVRLVKCAGSEKSYLDSHLLKEDELNTELDLGLCQAVDTVRPTVIIHQTFSGMMRGFLAGSGNNAAVKWVGDASSRGSDNLPLVASPVVSSVPFAVAIGPEKGFSTEEISTLCTQAGFKPMSLGSRQLRVEFALSALVGRCISTIPV